MFVRMQRYHDQQLDQGEAALVPIHLLKVSQSLSKKLQHVVLLACCLHAYTSVKPIVADSRQLFGEICGSGIRRDRK